MIPEHFKKMEGRKAKIGVPDPDGGWDTVNGYNYVFENISSKKLFFLTNL